MIPLRVLIVDDDDLMRAGLRAVLSSDDTVEVAGEAAEGREAVALARHLKPDVVLMDVRMPTLDGVAATREIVESAPQARVLILTTFEDDDYVVGALTAAPPASCSSGPNPSSSSPASTPSPAESPCCRRRLPGR